MKNIINFKRYECGKEIFNLSDLYSECHEKNIELPVNVFLMEHKKFGNILFNSGCSKLINQNRINSIKYKARHKFVFSDKENIVSRLSDDGFDPVLIKKVILTHANPECCGGLPLLPRYELISSAQVITTLDFALFADGVLKSTVPPDNIPRRAVIPFNEDIFLKKYFKWVYDIFGDKSVFGFDLSGHSKSMMGYYIPELNILYGADAAVTENAVIHNYTPTGKLLNNQYYPKEYLKVFDILKSIHNDKPEIQFIFLHSDTEIKF